MPADFTTAAEELRVLLAPDSSPEVVDDFIDLVENLPIASKGQAGKWGERTMALADVGIAAIDYQVAVILLSARRHRDFLRQFRDLKKWPTKRRLLNILERDTDENNLKPAESALRFGILRLGIFGDDIPTDWVERLGDRADLLREVAERVCDYFAYKVDDRGRPGNKPLEDYADRLAQIYGDLTARPITYAKATDTSRRRKAGDRYGPGLDFMLAGLRLIDSRGTPGQAAAQIDRLRTARRGAR